MKTILAAIRQQGFEITCCSDFLLEGHRSDCSLRFRRGVHTPLSHLQVGKRGGETLLCEAFYHEDVEARVVASLRSLELRGAVDS